jgi:hypothetical protein
VVKHLNPHRRPFIYIACGPAERLHSKSCDPDPEPANKHDALR